MKKIEFGIIFGKMAPLIGLITLIAAYFIIGSSKDINISYGIKAIINQSVVIAIVATGAVFIYTLGSFDISLGASVAVSSLIGGIVYIHTNSIFLMFIACLSIAVCVSLVNSILASIFNLPVFVTTIAMLSILNATVLMLISINGTGSQILVPAASMRPLDNLTTKISLLVIFILLAVVIFNITPLGRQQKFMGGNAECAKLTGLSSKKLSILAFSMAGVAVGLGAFLSIIYAPTLTKNTASSVGMDVIIAIVFGGMPVSGGARSRITAAVVGAFSMTFLSQIMSMLNLNVGIGQMVKAGIFIMVVYIATGSKKNMLLPR